eukprot:879555_1
MYPADADLPGETDWVSSQERMFPQFLNAVLRRSNAIPFNKSTARNAVKDLFHSDAIQVVLEKVMQEIARGTLAPRTDTILHSDVGVVEGVCSMLGSYEKEFLVPVLEGVCGARIDDDRSTPFNKRLRKFVKRVLFDTASFEKLYAPVVCSLTTPDRFLKQKRLSMARFLTIVYMLDQTKSRDLISGCLFGKPSKYKSTAEVLKNFSRLYLSGEGDICRHLCFLGYVVRHCQLPLDEFDPRVTCLSRGFRDGVRLLWLADALTGTRLMEGVHYPALTRAHKLDNATRAIECLIEIGGIPLGMFKSLSATSLIDGHREKTLAFLWLVLDHFHMA